MADRFRTAAEFRARMRGQSASVTVTYRRGGRSVDVSAGIGQTPFEQLEASGGVTTCTSRDYLIDAAALRLDGVEIEPAAGDQVVEVDARTNASTVFEVMPYGNNPCWRWSGSRKITRRIHTKQVS